MESKLRWRRAVLSASRGPDIVAAFLGARLGAEAVQIVGEPLLAGIHAGDARRLSMRATFPRLFEIGSRGQSLVRGMRAARRAQGGGAAAGFVSLEEGLGKMVDALVAGLPPPP